MNAVVEMLRNEASCGEGPCGDGPCMSLQKSRSTNRSVKDMVGALAYENRAMIERFAQKHDCSALEAERLFTETKKFLLVCVLFPHACSPSEVVDEMWHHFILHTRDYQEYCERFIGRFIHHTPTETPFVAARSEMLHFATDLFGSIDRDLWPKNKATGCDSSCKGDAYCSEGGGDGTVS